MTCNNPAYVDTEALSSVKQAVVKRIELYEILIHTKDKWLGDQPQQALRLFFF